MADANATIPSALRPVAGVGGIVRDALAFIGSLAWLLWDMAAWVSRALLLRQVRFGYSALVSQTVRVGVRAIGIVTLVSGAIGAILALQTEPSLADFGQSDKVANIIVVAVFRELGPLVAAIVLCGFAGAAIAAELGTMVVGEEIEALEAMALNPIRFLVVPRVLATAVSLFVLSVLSDLVAVTAGGLVGVFFLSIPYEVYWDNTLDQVSTSDFLSGLVKSVVFGLILGLIACLNGLRVVGGAAGVGKATTDTVVQTVVTIIVVDLFFTALFYAVGWN
ncbi:MAG: ABC transporter permease [Phycisphaerae bacterium]|nr:ABC transporter permease [Phycisphaerae bacterium]